MCALSLTTFSLCQLSRRIISSNMELQYDTVASVIRAPRVLGELIWMERVACFEAVDLKRAIPLFGLILKITKLGYISVRLLQIISESVVSLFLFRRRLLSVRDLVFQGCRGRPDGDIIQLSGKMKGELLTLACLLPVAVTNLRAKVQNRVVATDASSWGEAGVVPVA